MSEEQKPRVNRPRMTPEEWADARKRWERDPRPGFVWLVKDKGLPVTSSTVGKRANQEGWTKSAPKRSKAGNLHGRPSLYREEYAEQARKLCLLLGATNEELARFFGVSTVTIASWMNEHAPFLNAIKAGKESADANVASRLYERAMGYSHPDTDIRVIDGEIIQTELTKHYPPDTAAAFIWLKNRQPERWRDKVEVEQKTEMTIAKKEDLDAIYAEKMARMELGREQFSEREVVPADEA